MNGESWMDDESVWLLSSAIAICLICLGFINLLVVLLYTTVTTLASKIKAAATKCQLYSGKRPITANTILKVISNKVVHCASDNPLK